MNKKLRINKYLSLCGLGSRRKVEGYVINKKVKLNSKFVESLSVTVDPDKDIVEFNNKIINLIQKKYFIILNKPKGYVTSVKDEKDRLTVMDLIPDKYRRAMVVPVGRLDMNSEGLLLLTNAGDIAYKLTHPKCGVQKDYIAELDSSLKETDKLKIENGIYLYGEKTKPAKILILDKEKKIIKISISEGKKRHIRLAFDMFSYRVKSLKRISFGPLKLQKLHSGSYRLLRNDEIKKLYQVINIKNI